MNYRTNEMFVLNAVGILAKDFTAAVTGICTSAGHGFKNTDKVILTTTTTLPAGLALATIYFVKKIDDNTFYLCSDRALERIVSITNTGTGTHTATMDAAGFSKNIQDFDVVSIILATADDAEVKVQFLTSDSDTEPDFTGTKSVINVFDATDVVDNEDNSHIDGDTGITFAGTDDVRLFELNVNRKKWFNVLLSSYTAGAVTVKIVGHKI